MAERGLLITESLLSRLMRVVKRVEALPVNIRPRRRQLITPAKSDAVPFRNDYAGTVPAYGIVAVTGSATVNEAEYFTVDRPDATFRVRYLVNGPEAVAVSGYGLGHWLDKARDVAYDDSFTPAVGQEWGVWPDSFLLTLGGLGFDIQSAGDGTKVKAIQRTVTTLLGKLYGESPLEQGSTVDFKPWLDSDDDGVLEEGPFDPFEVSDFCLNTGDTIEADTKMQVSLYSNKWRVTNAWCEPDDTND